VVAVVCFLPVICQKESEILTVNLKKKILASKAGRKGNERECII
jgi:hypothetical protein